MYPNFLHPQIVSIQLSLIPSLKVFISLCLHRTFYPTIAVRLYSQLLVTQDSAILTEQVVIGRLFGISCRTRFETFE